MGQYRLIHEGENLLRLTYFTLSVFVAMIVCIVLK